MSNCSIPEGVRLTGGKLLVMVTLGITISVVSIGCNITILVAFFLKRSLQKCQNLLLVNLALGDIVYCLIGFPLYIMTDFDTSLICYDSILHVRHFVACFTISLSLNNIAAVACERFIAIQFPYYYRQHVTMCVTTMAAVLSWAASLVEATVFTVVYFNYDPKIALDLIIGVSAVIFILSGLTFIWINYVVQRHFKRDLILGVKIKDSKFKSAVLIAVVYVISWTPVLIVRIVNQVIDVGEWRQITVLFPLLGTCFNLLIYTYRMSDFRQALKGLLFSQRMKVHVFTIGQGSKETSV